MINKNAVTVKITFRRDRFYLYLPHDYVGQRVKASYDLKARRMTLELKPGESGDGLLLIRPTPNSKFAKIDGFYTRMNWSSDFARYDTECGTYIGRISFNTIVVDDFTMPAPVHNIKRKKSKKKTRRTEPNNKNARPIIKEPLKVENSEIVTVADLQNALRVLNLVYKQSGVTVTQAGDKLVLELAA